METFTFQPDWDMEQFRKPELMKNSFGDGYEQIRPKGLNHNLRTYSVIFTGTEDRIKQIDEFFNRQGGIKPLIGRRTVARQANSAAKIGWQELAVEDGRFRQR